MGGFIRITSEESLKGNKEAKQPLFNVSEESTSFCRERDTLRIVCTLMIRFDNVCVYTMTLGSWKRTTSEHTSQGTATHPNQGFAKGVSQTVSPRSFSRRNPKGWFPKGWFWRMFPRNENKNEGKFGCSPGTKNRNGGTFGCSPGTKTGTGVRSPNPPFYETALLSPGAFFFWNETEHNRKEGKNGGKTEKKKKN